MMPWLDESIAANGVAVRENFANWFGQSKVVDGKGLPLIVIHATLNEFDSFELGHGEAQSQAFFFAARENVDNYLWSYLDSLKYQEEERPGDHFFMPVFLSIQNPRYIETLEDDGNWADPDFENEEIRKAKSDGHDGLVITDHYMGTTFYVAFDPTQIKSALGNSGLYLQGSPSLADRSSALSLQASRSARTFIETSAEKSLPEYSKAAF